MGFFEKEELKYLGLFYLGAIIGTLFSVTEPIIIVYFALKGFTFSELSFAIAAFFIAPFIFEVPTGVIADIFGRKFSVILSLMLMGAGAVLVPFISDPFFLTALFFFIGFSKTLSTGADEAWIVDNLKYNKKSNLIQTFFVKVQSISAAAFVLSGLLSAGLMVLLGKEVIFQYQNISLIGYDLLWFVEAAGYFLTAIFGLFITEHFITKNIHPKHLIKHSIEKFKSGFSHSFDNPVIFHLILAAFFMVLAANIFGIVYQPFLIDLGVPTHYLGYTMSIIGAVGIFIPFIAKKIFTFIKKEKHYLSFVVGAQAVLIFLAFFIVSPFAGLTLIIILANIGGLGQPIERTYFQKYLKSKVRATVVSFESMFVHIGGAIAMVVGGFLADAVGPRATLAVSAIFIIPAVISYLSIHERKR
ncbi:MFS transporter [Candidatus Woesearchaeota archaeon]|nr:MFS transporter [Candidatus Woesearchaeota archaeon]